MCLLYVIFLPEYWIICTSHTPQMQKALKQLMYHKNVQCHFCNFSEFLVWIEVKYVPISWCGISVSKVLSFCVFYFLVPYILFTVTIGRELLL